MTDRTIFLLLMVSGTLFLGLYDISQKRVLKAGINDQFLLGASWILGALFLLPALFFAGIPAIGDTFLSAFVASVFLNILSQALFVRALQLSDASLIAPLRLIVSPLVILTGYFVLAEVPTPGGILGIFITLLGLWMLLSNEASFSLRNFSFLRQRGVTLALAGSFLFALSFPFDKQAVVHSSGLFATITIFFAVGVATLVLNGLFRPSFFHAIKSDIRMWWKQLIVIAVLGSVGGVLTNQALQYSLASYASSMKRLWSLWTVILAGRFLSEKNISRRLLATAIMFGGIIIMVIWG